MAPPSQLSRSSKRLPLSSTSAQHNKPRNPSSSSSPTKLQAPSSNKVVRTVKSNPSLPRSARPPPPPPLRTFPSTSTSTTTTTSTTSSSSSSSSIPHSPSYPLPNSEEAASLQRLVAPAGVTFGKELFLHRHERDFPHLHEVVPPKVVRRDTPASAVSSEEASVVGAGGAVDEEEKKENDENEDLSTPRRRKVRPLSLVLLQPSGGLFSPPKEELDVVFPASSSSSRPPTSVVERLVERESLDLDRRSSDEISSECDLDFAFDHTNNTPPPPPPRFKGTPINKPTTTTIPRPAFNNTASAAPLAVKFASSTTPGDHHRRPFAPPPSCLTPSTSGSSSSYTLLLGRPSIFPSLPPTPMTPSYHPFPSPPPPAATSTSRRAALPTNPSLGGGGGGHRRGPSITYRRSSSTSSTLPSAPSAGDLAPGAMSTSASNSTMTSMSGSIRVPRRLDSVEMERELFWHPSMVEEESMNEEERGGFGRGGGTLAKEKGKGKERDEGERPPGIGGAKRFGSGSSLVRKSASEGVGLRERYQEVEKSRNQSSTASLYGSTPNTPNSPYGFIHNPTPPSIHFNAPSSDAGSSSRSSWRDWFGGGASSSRRGSETIKHSADVLERGEGGGSGSTLRPGWMMSRKGSLPLPLPSPSYSFVSSGSGSGSSFGNAPGEIWTPSSPSSPSAYSPKSNGTFGPNSPHQTYSPSFPPGSDLRPPPQAVTIRRPLVSTSVNATLAGGRTSPSPSLSLSQQPQLQPLHRGLKPLELTLPPKPLRKKGGGLFSTSRTPLATIAGSPSKRDLEEGRGAGPSVDQQQLRSRTRSAPTARGSVGSDQDENENDENSIISPTPLEGYYLQSTHTPSSTPPRLRTRSGGEPSFALAVHPSTPLRYPSPPSPSLGKTSDLLPSHRRTYSTATSTNWSPSKLSKGSISYRPHNNAHLNLNVLSSTTGSETARRQSLVTFHDASSDKTAFTSPPSSSGGLDHASKERAGAGSDTLFNSTSTTTTTSRDHGQGGTATLVRPVSMVSMQAVYQRVMNAPRNWLDEVLPSQLIFMAGFLLGPWCWILGGWGLSSDGRFILTQLQGARPRSRTHLHSLSPFDQQQPPRWGSASARRSSFNSESERSSIGGQRSGGWLLNNSNNESSQQQQQQYQGQKWRTTREGRSGNGGRKKWLLPVLRSEGRDKWVWRCRVAAILSGCVLIPGLVLAVVFAAL